MYQIKGYMTCLLYILLCRYFFTYAKYNVRFQDTYFKILCELYSVVKKAVEIKN